MEVAIIEKKLFSAVAIAEIHGFVVKVSVDHF